MYSHTEKAKKSYGRIIATPKSHGKQSPGLVDNRLETGSNCTSLLQPKYDKREDRVEKNSDAFLPSNQTDPSLTHIHQPSLSHFIIQRQGTLEDFLNKVVVYIGYLERYSHQGYQDYGKTTKADVEKRREKLLAAWDSLDEAEYSRLVSEQINWSNVTENSNYHYDKHLILFHAANLHLAPLNSVSYIEGVSQYHQEHLATTLEDSGESNRNYATLYYDITAHFNMAGRPLTLHFSGSYAGRSGKYAISETLTAPAQRGYESHKVVSTDKSEQHYETFIDHHDRYFDSEVAVFEDLSQTISENLKKRGIPHYTTSGKINLFTDRATCNSCTALAMQFQNAWHVAVNVKHGGVDDYKGYGGIK